MLYHWYWALYLSIYERGEYTHTEEISDLSFVNIHKFYIWKGFNYFMLCFVCYKQTNCLFPDYLIENITIVYLVKS